MEKEFAICCPDDMEQAAQSNGCREIRKKELSDMKFRYKKRHNVESLKKVPEKKRWMSLLFRVQCSS